MGTPGLSPSPVQTYSLGILPPDLFKLVHYVAHTSIDKRAVGLRLKGSPVICEVAVFHLKSFELFFFDGLRQIKDQLF